MYYKVGHVDWAALAKELDCPKQEARRCVRQFIAAQNQVEAKLALRRLERKKQKGIL